MNVVELKRLSNFLRNEVADHEFDLGVWVTTKDGKKERRTACGTVGCAIGLGCLRIPEWQAQGFVLSDNPNMGGRFPVLADAEGFSAIMKFFDISLRDSFRLFTVGHYDNGSETTRHDVADRIDRLLKEGTLD